MSTCALTCSDAKKIDLVDYLASLGHHPKKVSHPDYWYLSPFRDEKTASFKVNRKLGVWYGHATGNGGDLIDFGTRIYNCSVSEFLHRLAGQLNQNYLSFHLPTQASKNELRPAVRDTFSAGKKKENPNSKIPEPWFVPTSYHIAGMVSTSTPLVLIETRSPAPLLSLKQNQ
jgi:hypothetical protein